MKLDLQNFRFIIIHTSLGIDKLLMQIVETNFNEQCSNMNVPRSLFYFGELDGLVYAVSGCTASNADTYTAERYLPGQDSWEMIAPLEVRVHELAGGFKRRFLLIDLGDQSSLLFDCYL